MAWYLFKYRHNGTVKFTLPILCMMNRFSEMNDIRLEIHVK